MPAVRTATAWRPAVFFQHAERAQIFHQTIRQRAVELQPVAIAAHAAMANQVACVLHRKQIFTRGHRVFVMLRQLGLQLIVERIACFFVPEQAIRLQRLGVFDGGFQIKAAIGIHRQILACAHDFDHRLDAPNVIRQRITADFHLDHRVAQVEIFLHLVLQCSQILAGVIVATRSIDKHLVVHLTAVVTLSEQLV